MYNNERTPSGVEKNCFSSLENIHSYLNHPTLSCSTLTWEQVFHLQSMQYPEATDFQRNLLVLPYPVLPSAQEHNHTFFEMIYVSSGTCSQYVENHFTLLKEGDFCILPPGISHTLLNHDASEVILILVHNNTMKSLSPFLSVGQDLMSNFFHDIICKNHLSHYLLLHTEKEAYINQGILSIKEEMKQNDECSDHIALAKLVDLLLNLNRICKNTKSSSEEAFISPEQKILSTIYEQYTTITLAQLAETMHYSVPYCSKYLKKNLGCTFSELVQKLRFQQAKNLLIHSNLPVNQIGKNIGYETPENFFRAFKKVYGITPSQFRRMEGKTTESKK